MKPKYTVKVVADKLMHGRYWGMNYYANKELKEHIPIKKNEILVSDKASPEMRRRTILHEKMEAHLMRDRGLKYNKAHRVAEAFDEHMRR